MEPTHLSLYQLTIEAGTAFGDRHARGGLLGLPSEDLAADLFEVTQEMCGAAGLPAYEVSNHAIPGQESRHNMIYWQAGDYIGIGPGAHGRLTKNSKRGATEAHKAPGKWLDLVEKGAVPEVAQVDLSGPDQAQEYLLMGLRVAGGIDRARYRTMCGRDLPLAALDDMAGDGFLDLHGDNVRTTAAGRPILNAILRKLVAG